MSNISKLALILACLTVGANANAPLAHEALVDSAWPKDIKPLLLARFPGANEEALNTARGYAYGGSIIQDMGYYPFGSRFFTDLVHYARSGDFVLALLRDAQDINELAFALGALAHYTSDKHRASRGHQSLRADDVSQAASQVWE